MGYKHRQKMELNALAAGLMLCPCWSGTDVVCCALEVFGFAVQVLAPHLIFWPHTHPYIILRMGARVAKSNFMWKRSSYDT